MTTEVDVAWKHIEKVLDDDAVTDSGVDVETMRAAYQWMLYGSLDALDWLVALTPAVVISHWEKWVYAALAEVESDLLDRGEES